MDIRDKFDWLISITSSMAPGGAIRAAVVLVAHHNGKTGRCDPSVKTIANQGGLTRRGAQSAIAWLRDNDWIKQRVGGGRGHTNAYELVKRRTPVRGFRGTERRTPVRGLPDINSAQTCSKGRTNVQQRAHRGSPEHIEQFEHRETGERKVVSLTDPQPDMDDMAAKLGLRQEPGESRSQFYWRVSTTKAGIRR